MRSDRATAGDGDGLASLREAFRNVPRLHALAFQERAVAPRVAAGRDELDRPLLSLADLQSSILRVQVQSSPGSHRTVTLLSREQTVAARETETAGEGASVVHFVVLGMLPSATSDGDASPAVAGGYDRFAKSCEVFAVPHRIVHSGGAAAAQAEIAAALEEFGDETVVLVVDAATSLISAPPAAILEQYHSMHSSVVLAGMRPPRIPPSPTGRIQAPPPPLRFPNYYPAVGSAVIGTLSSLRALFAATTTSSDAATCSTLACVLGQMKKTISSMAVPGGLDRKAAPDERPAAMKIDSSAQLFQSYAGEKAATFQLSRAQPQLRNLLSTTTPSVHVGLDNEELFGNVANSLAANDAHILGHHPTRRPANAK